MGVGRSSCQFGGVSPFPIPNEPNGTLDINKILQVRHTASTPHLMQRNGRRL